MASKSKPAPRIKVPKPDARSVLLTCAMTMDNETRQLDFKGEFKPTKEGWCGVIKDIMAMANTGGGIIVFGCQSNGKSSGVDCAHVADIDVADFTNKIFSYTGYHFGGIEVLSVSRGRDFCPVVLVGAADIPVPVTKPGEYDVIDAKGKRHDKIAFHAGTIYFRHGAKSEPATRADMEHWIRRHTDRERKTMMDGVKKVVTAPIGSMVHVLPKGSKLQVSDDALVKVRYSTDANAIPIATPALDKSHPYKRAQMITELAKALGVTINTHDATCINRLFKIFATRRDLAIKPHRDASPQYSPLYIDFVAQQLAVDPDMLAKARQHYAGRNKQVSP